MGLVQASCDSLILLCNPSGVHVVSRPLLGKFLSDHGVDALLKRHIFFPQAFDVHHRVDYCSLINLHIKIRAVLCLKTDHTFLMAAIF